jgi:Tfp pilus assembly protein PilF
MVTQEAVGEVLEIQADGGWLSAGTAFAISREFALTAFHVIGNRETGVVGTNPIVLRFLRRREDDWTEPYECGARYHEPDECGARYRDAELDFAVLQLKKPLPNDLRPIALTNDFDAHERFVSAGHPGLEGPDISHVHGTVVAPQTSIFGGVPAIQLHCDEAGDQMPLKGMSGAPVLVGSGAKRAAIGLIRWNPTKPDDEEALAVGGMVHACPVKPLAERLSAYGARWIARRAVADLVLQYPFPKVSEADCYKLLGVWRSEYVDQYQAEGKMPPYVPRQIDNALRHALEQKDFVLLVGPSKAGKTRTAYEALLKVAPSIPMVVPSKGEDLAKIVEELQFLADHRAKSMLWLNDVENFLSKGTLTLRVVNTALHEFGMQIVATMRSSELSRWKGLNDEIGRDAQRVFERAEVIKLEDQMTPQEEERTRATYPDLKLWRGLGESFIAGQELRQRYDYGGSPMVAVVRAANDWRRTGFTAPIQRDDLFGLFKRHFEDLEPAQDATEEVFKAGVEDARKTVARYSALLYRERSAEGAEGYYVVDYVSDYLETQGYPMIEEAWKLALQRVQSKFDCLAVGLAAYERERSDIAARAWVIGVGYSSAASASNLGILLAEQGRPEEAEAALREALRIDPQLAHAHSNLGNLLAEQGHPVEAEAALREALRIDPQLAQAHSNLGNLLAEQGRPEEAEEAYREALRIDPQDAKVYSNLGHLLTKQGRPVEAEAALREALRIDPQDTKAHSNLGILLAEQGRLAEAEEAYREALRINPQNAEGHYNLGVLLVRQGRPVEAEEAYRGALRIDPQDAEGHYNLGVLLAEQGRLAEAEEAYREALRINPQDTKVHTNLGILLVRQGRPVEAEEAYREALRINPQDTKAHSNLGVLLAEQGHPVEAEAALREALRIDPQDAKAHYNLGVLLARQGRPVEAEEAYRGALRIDPQDAEVHYSLGVVLAKQGRPVEAEAALREALRIDPRLWSRLLR